MELEQVFPTEFGSFKLKATKDHVHVLRKFTIEDHAWVKTNLGMTIVEVLQLGDKDPLEMWEKLSRVIYRLLLDKSPFQKQTVQTFDEDGEKKTEVMGGPTLLRLSMAGTREPTDVMAAFTQCLKESDPVMPVQKKTEENPTPPSQA